AAGGAALAQRLEVAALERDLPKARRLLERAEPQLSDRRAARALLLVGHVALEAEATELALALAERAAERAPMQYEPQALLARAAIAEGSPKPLGRAAERMLALAPEAPYGYYAAAALAAAEGRGEEARAALAEARARGMDAAS